MVRAYIAGTGHFVPPNRVTNADLVARFGIDTTPDWIVERTGIEARHFADDGVGVADMAVPACQAAIARAGVALEDVDFIVFATLSPEHAFPGSGVYLQAKLGLVGVPAMDIRNQCSGFVYALAAAKGLVESGLAQTVLVVGAEKHSAALDFSTRGRAVACLFGDAAAAAVVRGTDHPTRGVRWMSLGADGRHADALAQKVWDTRKRPFIPVDAAGNGVVEPALLWAEMDGKFVFRRAAETLVMCAVGMCLENKISLETDVDLVVAHQANLRLNELVRTHLGLPPEKMPANIQRYGNTTAATIPLLLSELEANGTLRQGMTVALLAFGSGFTWGAALLEW